MKMVFVMKDCGCRLHREDLVDPERGSGLRCPVHNENKIDHCETECERCRAQLLNLSPKQSMKRFCDRCAKELKKIRDASANTKERRLIQRRLPIQKISKEQEAASDRWDCAHREWCLNENLGAKVLPCMNCEHYESMTAEATEAGKGYQTSKARATDNGLSLNNGVVE